MMSVSMSKVTIISILLTFNVLSLPNYFRYRKLQTWPPKVVNQEGWEEIYAMQKLDLPVLTTVAEAIEWTNQLISKIDAAR